MGRLTIARRAMAMAVFAAVVAAPALPTANAEPSGTVAPLAVSAPREVDLSKATGAVPNRSINDNAFAVSPNGKWVAFWSQADYLVPAVKGGLLGQSHLYIASLATGRVVSMVDRTPGGVVGQGPSSYPDALAIAWAPNSDAIAYASYATNLATITGPAIGPYLYTRLVNPSTGGAYGDNYFMLSGVDEAAWSPNGTRLAVTTSKYVRYGSAPGSAQMVWWLDVQQCAAGSCSIYAVSTSSTGVFPLGYEDSYQPSWSPNGARIAFTSEAKLGPSDTNDWDDVYVKTLSTGAVQRVSVRNGGATNPNAAAREPSWSPDGRYIAFSSRATNLVAGDTNRVSDVFARVLTSSQVIRVSVNAAGGELRNGIGNFLTDGSSRPQWSPDGKWIAFNSTMTDVLRPSGPFVLPPSGSLPYTQVYVKNTSTGATKLVSMNGAGVRSNSTSSIFSVSYMNGSSSWVCPSGVCTTMVFVSNASNLGANHAFYRRNLWLRKFL